MTNRDDLIAEGKAAYQEFRDEILATPELRQLYAEEGRKLDLALKLAAARRSVHLTQAEVARRMGVSQRRVSAIEHADTRDWNVSTLFRYVDALGGAFTLDIEVRRVGE